MMAPVLRTERIAHLREWQFVQRGWPVERLILYHRAHRRYRNLPIGERHGRVFRYLLERLPVDINDDELIVGRVARREPTDQDNALLDSLKGPEPSPAEVFLQERITPEARESAAQSRHYAGYIMGHMTPGYPTVLRSGLVGIRRTVRARLERSTKDEERDFCRGAIYGLDGVIQLARRYAAHARQLAETASPARRQELLRIGEMCRRVPAYSPRTFHEAAQTLWFIHLNVAQEVSGYHTAFCPGRVDQYLWPYYRRDIASGRLTREEAYEILACLFLKYNEFEIHSSPQTLFVGGQQSAERTGKRIHNVDLPDASNDVSLLCLEVARDLQMLHPALCVSWHPKLDCEVMRRATELMATGIGFPAIFNDQAIVPGLMRDGATREEAVDYVAGSCVEISIIGKSNPWVASGYINAGKVVERAVEQVARQDRPTWVDLVSACKAELAEALRHNVEMTSAYDEAKRQFQRYPFLSCLVEDCIERATDMTMGGARYNPTEPSLVGLPNVVDSLMAIKWACYDRNMISLRQLADVLRRNWDGEEALRRTMSTKPPRYCNDLDEPDHLFCDLADFWYSEARRYTNPRGGPYQPGFLCYVVHGLFGAKTGATPDGRRAGEALADSIGPVQGHDTSGVTAMLRSAAKMDHTQFMGGLVTNVKFSPSLFASAADRERVIDLLEGYLSMGAFQVQVNVVSAETLKDARVHPEQYSDMIVRVAGFSDYFTRLSPSLQDEIIRRTEYAAV